MIVVALQFPLVLRGSMFPSEVRLIVPPLLPVTAFSKSKVAPPFCAVRETVFPEMAPDVETDDALLACTRNVPVTAFADPDNDTAPALTSVMPTLPPAVAVILVALVLATVTLPDVPVAVKLVTFN